MGRDLTLFSDFFNSDPFFTGVNSGVSKYPLTDISFDKKNNILHIDIALAGCPKDQISISQDGNFLIVEGEMTSEDESEGVEYIQKHIAQRKFFRKIKLAPEFAQGNIDASYENGLLTISITPSKEYHKKIEIK